MWSNFERCARFSARITCGCNHTLRHANGIDNLNDITLNNVVINICFYSHCNLVCCCCCCCVWSKINIWIKCFCVKFGNCFEYLFIYCDNNKRHFNVIDFLFPYKQNKKRTRKTAPLLNKHAVLRGENIDW